MERNIIQSDDPAKALNKAVQKNVADHLFLICNYDVNTPITAYGDDAKFYTAIVNLYKFLIDAGIINKLSGLTKNYRELIYDKQLGQIIEMAKCLRTVFVHNESELSANDQDKETVKEWLKSTIRKPEVDDIGDYKELLSRIEWFGNESVSKLKGFVASTLNVKEHAKLVSDWEQLIINFYKSSNSVNILKGQLRKAYQARSGSNQNYIMYRLDITPRNLADWVKRMYFLEQQNEFDKFINILNNYGTKLPINTLMQVKATIEQKGVALEERKEELARNMNKDVSELDKSPFPYMDYYILNLPERIQSCLKQQLSKEFGTLLPQDIICYLIEKDFADVPIQN